MKLRKRKKKDKSLPKANYVDTDGVGVKKNVHVKSVTNYGTGQVDTYGGKNRLGFKKKPSSRYAGVYRQTSTTKDLDTGETTSMTSSQVDKSRKRRPGTKSKVRQDFEVKDKYGRTTMKSTQKTNNRGVTRERGYIVKDGRKKRYRGKF